MFQTSERNGSEGSPKNKKARNVDARQESDPEESSCDADSLPEVNYIFRFLYTYPKVNQSCNYPIS